MGIPKGKDGKPNSLDCGKYARYTPEQVEILERIYNDCPKPNSSRRQQLIRDCPILANIGHKQLKVWFQNRRCREKQRKEMSRLQSWNSKLNAMNQLLLEENERLQKQAVQLSSENHYLRQKLQTQQSNVDVSPHVAKPVILPAADTGSESIVTSGQHQHSPEHPSQEWSFSQLSSIAEKMLEEFLSKATGTAIDGILLPGMKPGPDSIGAFTVTRSSGGVAAQACSTVALEPFKVAEIAKNRPLWLRDCRRLDILASFTADRGGMVELVHTQMYAPVVPSTTDVPWDFWTLRYTCCLDDGSLVICERSLAAGQVVQEIPLIPGFARAEMLTSGFLIRPYEQGGSMVMVIDDMNFKAGRLLDGSRPRALYDTAAILARRVTERALCHLHSTAKAKLEAAFMSDPISSLCGFTQRLIRGFNDAINGFHDEGWVSLINDGPTGVSVHINSPSACNSLGALDGRTRLRGGIVCAKASLMLHSVLPALLLHFVRERWVGWADVCVDVSQEEVVRTSLSSLPKKKFSSVQVLPPVLGQDEVLEVVRVQRSGSPRGEGILQPDNFLLQLCSSMEEFVVGEYAQLIFAPIDASVPDDAPLLPSGFRVMHMGGTNEELASSQTLDLASSIDDRLTINRMPFGNHGLVQEHSTMVTIAFQYTYKTETRDLVALNAQQHVQALVDVLQQAAVSFRPQVPGMKCGMEALVLVQQLVDSYRSYLHQELLPCIGGNAEDMFRSFWFLKDAIVCCTWKPLPEFVFANHSALEMLETSSSSLKDFALERMFHDSCRKTDYSQPPPFIQKDGYACLPSGICRSSTGRPVSFERATGWKVITNDHNTHVAAFMFSNWAFAIVPTLL